MKKVLFFAFVFGGMGLNAQEKPVGVGFLKVGILTESELDSIMIQQGKIKDSAVGDEDFYNKILNKNLLIQYEPNLKNLDDNLFNAYFLPEIIILNATNFKLNDKYQVENGYLVFAKGKLLSFMLNDVDEELFADFQKKYGNVEKKKIIRDEKCGRTFYKEEIVYEIYKNNEIEVTLSTVFAKDKTNCSPKISHSITGENATERMRLDKLNEERLQELEKLEFDKL